MQQASDEEHGETVRECSQQRADEKEETRREEQPPHCVSCLEKSRERDDHGKHEQIARRDPLNDGDTDVKFLHQRREGDVHCRLNDDACKGHQTRREEGEQELCVNTAFELKFR